MLQNQLMVPLGITEDRVQVGTHICLIFSNERERVDSLLKFLLLGLQMGERVACFSDRLTEKELRDFLQMNGISYNERSSKEAIVFSGASEIYFKNGVFDPDRMLKILTEYYKKSENLGFPASRVIGEMKSEVADVPGGERFLEYESRVSILLRDYPVTSICQYDANSFDGATLMEVLKVHPKMIVNGAVINNPFFVEPEIYLAERFSK